jgi:hypothetical protein
MPEPMMHISASAVRGPVLPARARGFTPGAPSIQKERVALDTGNDSEADSGGGEKIAWNWSCNGPCKVICEKPAELCMPTRPTASNWRMWKSVMMIIEATRGHCNEDTRRKNSATAAQYSLRAGSTCPWPRNILGQGQKFIGRLAQLVRASC